MQCVCVLLQQLLCEILIPGSAFILCVFFLHNRNDFLLYGVGEMPKFDTHRKSLFTNRIVFLLFCGLDYSLTFRSACVTSMWNKETYICSI